MGVALEVGNRHIQEPLVSNGYKLSMHSERLGWLIPTDPRQPRDVLRQQYREQGYLWLKGLLPREEVLAFRRRFFAAMESTGLLAPGSDPEMGIYAGGGEDQDLRRKAMMEIVRTAAFEAFCLQPQIIRFYEQFLEGPVYLHKRKILRDYKPQQTNSTPAHYDLVYLRGGTNRLCTSWIPIGDCPVEMGGLIYLEGSDALGREFEAEYAVKNADLPPEERVKAYNKNMAEGGWITKDLSQLANRAGTRWLVADYEAGDMVVHSPYMIHASTQNTDTAGRIRLSTDIRYQRIRDEIDVRWSNHWSFDDML